MKAKDFILKQVRRKGLVRTYDVTKALKISRQTAHQHLRELIDAKKLMKIGSTRNAAYVPYSAKKASILEGGASFLHRYRTRGLEEDRAFREVALRLNLQKRLSEPAFKIVSYAFTEMLNNAIDHSKSPLVKVEFRALNGKFEFFVIDNGIGVFESIRRKFKLRSHFSAAEHLLKGKQTTDPKRHSGQGIFFTSKIADLFSLESAKLKLIIDNKIDDVFLEDIKNVKGTRVRFLLKKKSRKNLKTLFDDYSTNDYEFGKTKIVVHLSEEKGQYVSRSEAKRLLFGLEKFRQIIFDFKKVKAIGQGFADEIFRVFQNAYPDIQIETVGMSDSVAFMVKRASRRRGEP